MEMKKVETFFLSHEMSRHTPEQVFKIRDYAREIIENCKFYQNCIIRIVDNYIHPDAPEDAGGLWHLGKSIQELDTKDIIFVRCHPFNKSRGCQIEDLIVELYNLRKLDIYLPDDLLNT